jgi:hypothetical protein
MMVILLQRIQVCCGPGIEKDRDSEKKIKIKRTQCKDLRKEAMINEAKGQRN